MKTFKYKVSYIQWESLSQLERELNAAGTDGWEFISMTEESGHSFLLIYKKEI